MTAPAASPDNLPALHARAFTNALYQNAGDGWWEFRPTNAAGALQLWFPISDLPGFSWLLRKYVGSHGYFGVHLRREDGCGGRRNISRLVAVFIDVDAKTAAREAEFKEKLKAFPLPPTLGVRTGSPFASHIYWVLREPLNVMAADGINEETETAYRRVMTGLARHFGGDHIDDLPRVMRLPGSVNLKPGNGGTLARLAYYKPERTYPFSAFEPWMAEPPAKSVTQLRPVEERDPDDPDTVDLLAEFKRRGWLLDDQGGDMIYVRCPWDEQHTSKSGKSATAIWLSGNRWCFRCWHSHCVEHRRVAQVYEYFRLMRIADVLREARA